jgi:hypothetical protein
VRTREDNKQKQQQKARQNSFVKIKRLFLKKNPFFSACCSAQA